MEYSISLVPGAVEMSKRKEEEVEGGANKRLKEGETAESHTPPCFPILPDLTGAIPLARTLDIICAILHYHTTPGFRNMARLVFGHFLSKERLGMRTRFTGMEMEDPVPRPETLQQRVMVHYCETGNYRGLCDEVERVEARYPNSHDDSRNASIRPPLENLYPPYSRYILSAAVDRRENGARFLLRLFANPEKNLSEAQWERDKGEVSCCFDSSATAGNAAALSAAYSVWDPEVAPLLLANCVPFDSPETLDVMMDQVEMHPSRVGYTSEMWTAAGRTSNNRAVRLLEGTTEKPRYLWWTQSRNRDFVLAHATMVGVFHLCTEETFGEWIEHSQETLEYFFQEVRGGPGETCRAFVMIHAIRANHAGFIRDKWFRLFQEERGHVLRNKYLYDHRSLEGLRSLVAVAGDVLRISDITRLCKEDLELRAYQLDHTSEGEEFATKCTLANFNLKIPDALKRYIERFPSERQTRWAEELNIYSPGAAGWILSIWETAVAHWCAPIDTPSIFVDFVLALERHNCRPLRQPDLCTWLTRVDKFGNHGHAVRIIYYNRIGHYVLIEFEPTSGPFVVELTLPMNNDKHGD